MRRSWLISSALTLAFVIGFGLSHGASWLGSKKNVGESGQLSDLPDIPARSTFALPVAAQQAWFPAIENYLVFDRPLEDEKFNALLRILEQRIGAKETLADFEREAGFYFHSFLSRIAAPKLTPAQLERADSYFLLVAQQYPEHRLMLEQNRQLLKDYARKNYTMHPFVTPDVFFPDAKTLNTHGEPFADVTIDELIDVLDTLLSAPDGVFWGSSQFAAGGHIGRFIERLGHGYLTDAQVAQVGAYLDQIKSRFPDASEYIDWRRYQVRNLMPGRMAPNIVGSDLGGVKFELNEYQGEIVVLYFSGHWCAPCRTEYPYQRFMLELFKDEPVTILGVNSDDEIETIREAKKDEGLHYRVWWDGHEEEPTKGPIATAWKVTRWPSIYILDEKGVVRFVNKRHAEVITVVNKLLVEKKSGMAQ